MGKLHALMPRMGGRSPERAALAELIEQSSSHSVKLADAIAAEERAALRVVEAEGAHQAAEKALHAAKDAEATALIAHTETGAQPVSARSMREFRADLTDAADALETAKMAHATLQARRLMEQNAGGSNFALLEAVASVLRPAGLALLTEVEALQRELVRKRISLRMAAKQGLLTQDYATRRRFNEIMLRVQLPAEDANYGSREYGWPAEWDAGAGQEWLEARDALMKDPDAALPVSAA